MIDVPLEINFNIKLYENEYTKNISFFVNFSELRT